MTDYCSYYFSKSLNDLTYSDIQSFFQQQKEESITLEFKSGQDNTKSFDDILNKKDNSSHRFFAEKLVNTYTAFKIRKTLPEIEKYQNAHPLKTDNLNTFITKQNKLLEELKKFK